LGPGDEQFLWIPVSLADHVYDPTKSYCGLYAVSIREPPKSPTAQIIQLLSMKGMSLISIKSQEKDRMIYDFMIIETTGCTHTKEDLTEEIKEAIGDSLIYLEFVETNVSGFIYNVKGFPLVFNHANEPMPVTAVTHSTWKTFFSGMVKRFGSGGMVMLWFMGNDAGEAEGMEAKILSGKLTVKARLNISLAKLQALGWGRFELAECDEGRVIIRVFENFEDIVTKGLANYRNTFLRGFLVGLVSVFFNKACRGVELKCINRGDPYCEFMIR